MSDYQRIVYDICEGNSLAYLVLGILCVIYTFLCGLNFYTILSYRLSFALRWLGFLLGTSCIYLFLKDFIGLGGEITLVLLSSLFSLWFILSYAWVEASIYSKKNILPFSNLIECENAWRPDRQFYKLKQDIEAKGFERLKSYKATNRLSLATLFYNEQENVALLVLFRPRWARLRTIFYFISKSDNAKYLLFTNDYTDEMLFLKHNYSLHYRSLSHFKGLYSKHKRRMKHNAENYINFKESSQDIPHLLYNDNLQKGLELNIYSKARNEGQLLSQEGKFQFCKKLIIRKYFRI